MGSICLGGLGKNSKEKGKEFPGLPFLPNFGKKFDLYFLIYKYKKKCPPILVRNAHEFSSRRAVILII